MRVRQLFLLFLGILLTGLVSCNRQAHRHPGKMIFRYNESAGLVNLDPAFARDLPHIWVCNQLYNGLVQLDDSLHVRPAIARRWTISPDGKTYTFYLRKDVLFHNDPVFHGKKRRVTAADFVYSFQRLVNPKTASPGSWVFDDVADTTTGKVFRAINDTTLQIRLKHPFPPFLGILTMQYGDVVPHEAVDYYGSAFRRHPVGTGPFFLKNWVEGVKMVLQKNPDYFERDKAGHRLPYLDAVSISFLRDKMTAFLEFSKGELDFISGIDPSYKDELLTRTGQLRSKFRHRVKMLKSPYLNTEYLGILVDTNLKIVKNSPLRLKAVRQAINYAFDRKKMIKYLRNGIGIPGNKGIIPPGLPAFDAHAGYGYSYQPEKARKLLTEAGFGPGHPMPPITLVTTSAYVDLYKYVQARLNDVGFDAHINVMPAGSMRETKAQAKLPFFRASWIADYPDEENYLSLFYSKNFTPNGPNYTHFSSPVFDRMYEKSLRMVNDKSRRKLYRKMDSLVMAQAPVVILYYDEVLRFVQKDVTGLGINPVNLLKLKRVRKDKE
ncbi:MAG: peptide ABC transporter substrate-binding protein [bacterium]|nr:MAG: peptide ABC transporter substrate-binding protein [bacterium]